MIIIHVRTVIKLTMTLKHSYLLQVHLATFGNPSEACFLGGSVLAQLPSFAANWVGRGEFAAQGMEAVRAKCQISF